MHSDAPGDSGEFEAWVRPHLPVMARVAARLAPGADRDDVLQESLTRAWRRRSTFDPSRGTPAAWLCAVVADRARRAAGRQRSLSPPAHEAAADPVCVDLDVDLERAVSSLSRRQRETVHLRYYVGLSTAETAAVLNLSEGTVKSTLSDARARLRLLLAEEYA